MALQLAGGSGSIMQVDASWLAARFNVRPLDHGALGAYRLSVVSGILAATLAAGAVVFSARWGDATRLAHIFSLRTRFLPLTLFTAATLTDATSFDAVTGRTFTASHTGGTALTLSGNSFKSRASMGATLFTDLRIATTAALGGAAGLTLDPHPISQSLRKANRVNPAAATEETIPPTADGLNLDYDVDKGVHALILTTSEGVIVRNRTVWPAAGTGQILVEMIWAELTSYGTA